MKDNSYKLIGYYNRRKEKEFSFAIPVFKKEGKIFRSELNEKKYTIENFSPIICDFKEIKNGKKYKIGQEAVYFFVYKQNVIYGTKLEISVNLLKLLRHNNLGTIDIYDIFYFLGISKKIENSLNNIINEYADFQLTQNNFIKPRKLHLNLAELSLQLKFYASLLEQSYRMIDYSEYFTNLHEKVDGLNLMRFQINKEEVENSFDKLIEEDKSDYYKDLVVYFFQINKMEELVKDNQEYRLRILIPITNEPRKLPINSILLKNSISINQLIKNPPELSIAFKSSIGKITKVEKKDMANTMQISKMIKREKKCQI